MCAKFKAFLLIHFIYKNTKYENYFKNLNVNCVSQGNFNANFTEVREKLNRQLGFGAT